MLIEVNQKLSAGLVENDGADRHPQHDVIAASAEAIGAATIFTTLAKKLAGVAVIDQRIKVSVANDVDTAAATAIAPIRPAQRGKFLAAKGSNAISAVASFNVDLRLVNEFHLSPLPTKKPYPADRAFGLRRADLCAGRNDDDRAAILGTLDGKLDDTILECE